MVDGRLPSSRGSDGAGWGTARSSARAQSRMGLFLGAKVREVRGGDRASCFLFGCPRPSSEAAVDHRRPRVWLFFFVTVARGPRAEARGVF